MAKLTNKKPDKSDIPKSGTKEAMLYFLIKSLGVVTAAASKAGIHRDTHYEWLKEDLDYKRMVEEVKEIAIDFVETKMFAAINTGDTSMMRYYLSTQGKRRGYIERQEITGKDGEPIQTTIIKWGDKEIKV